MIGFPNLAADRPVGESSHARRSTCHAAVCVAIFFSCLQAFASNLVTGNGFGFAVVAPETAAVTRFYAHPYSFTRPDPSNPLSEGIPTANFIKRLAWSAATPGASASYDDDSQVIRMHSEAGDGLAFMPFGFDHSVLIVGWTARDPRTPGHLEVEWTHSVTSSRSLQDTSVVFPTLPQHGSSRAERSEADGPAFFSSRWMKQTPKHDTSARILRFAGLEESLLLVPLDMAPSQATHPDQPLSGSDAWALIAIEDDSQANAILDAFQHWRVKLSAEALAKREVAEMNQWRVQPSVHFASEQERHLWRQSEILLRVAQSREPNTATRHGNGLMVASLPDGLFFTPWVRDMAWATVAFTRMGHQHEARAALLAYCNAQPTGKMRAQVNNADYQVSVVRYFGDGAEEPFFTMEGSTNIEFDDWGEVLWVLGEYLDRFRDPALLTTATYRGPLYQSVRDYIVKPLLANLEPYGDGLIVAADTSIWEEREKDKKHFAFSTAAAILGLRSFARVAEAAGDQPARADALHQAGLLEQGFRAAFIRDGELHGTLEPGVKNDIDGALLPIINFGIVTDPKVIRSTVERMQLLKVASGGYRRVRSTYSDPKIYEYWYEREEFLFVDLSLAQLLRRLGQSREADAMLARITAKAAADHNLIPEMYVSVPCELFPGKIGDPTGALPMAGYGAAAYILHLIDRERFAKKP